LFFDHFVSFLIENLSQKREEMYYKRTSQILIVNLA